MTKVLRCGDMMAGCDYVARAESEEELMQKAVEQLGLVQIRRSSFLIELLCS